MGLGFNVKDLQASLKNFSVRKLYLLVFIIPFFQATDVHGQRSRFYIANDDHTDYVWTADEATYKGVMLSTLDNYLVQIDSSIRAGLPFEYQSKFNCDGNFWFWLYEKNKSRAAMNNLISRVKSGHISVPYNPLAVLYGGLPAEASLRGMYFSGYLQKKYGIDMTLAMSMESAGQPLGLSSLWAGSGVKYSWKGICDCASLLNKDNLNKRSNEAYYYEGLDGQRVLMKWYSMASNNPQCGGHANQSLGGYAEARCLTGDLIERMRQKSVTTNHNVVGAFGYGWDDLITYTNGFIKLAKASSNVKEQVIVSNETDYFKDMEASYGKELPHETLARGNEWDLYIASMAEVSARIKRSTEKLRAAEAIATLVSLQYPDFAKDLEDVRDSAWMSVGLYPEHDWTADGPVSRNERAAFQRKLEHDYSRYVDTLYARGLSLLSKQIRKTEPGAETFFVFNALNWQRDDVADIPYEENTGIVVYDIAEKKPVPVQPITLHGKNYVRILASRIPAVGYKVFKIMREIGLPAKAAADLVGNIFENGQYKITLTKEGAITSLVDKLHGGRELVTVSPEGRYLNDMGSGSSDKGSDLKIENAGPVSVTIRATTKNLLKHSSSITLYHSLVQRIDIENNITQNFSGLISNTFSLNFAVPEIWHEETGAIIKAKLSDAGGHYATNNARYDWLTLNHFAAIGKSNYFVTISNRDCYFFKVGKSTPEKLDQDASAIHVLVGGQTDGDNLGILHQGGDTLFTQQFSLAVQNSGFSKTEAMKTSLEFQEPLIAYPIYSSAGATLPHDTFSLLRIQDPNLILWALKPAEEGIKNGLIARLWNLNDQQVNASMVFGKKILAANETTHVEINTKACSFKKNSVDIGIPGLQMKTFRINLE